MEVNDAIRQLSSYSFSDLVLLLVAVLAIGKWLSSAWDYAYQKMREHFNIESDNERQVKEWDKQIKEIGSTIDDMADKVDALQKKLDESNKSSEENKRILMDRIQEEARTYIIDRHHLFVYQVKAIDDFNLENLETKYMYYKGAGGDSFVDGLMDEVRSLKRVPTINGLM